MKIENRIRAVAKRKVTVSVTRRARSKNGFKLIVDDNENLACNYPNKKTALAAMFAQLRCAPVQRWKLVTA